MGWDVGVRLGVTSPNLFQTERERASKVRLSTNSPAGGSKGGSGRKYGREGRPASVVKAQQEKLKDPPRVKKCSERPDLQALKKVGGGTRRDGRRVGE